MPHAPLRSPEPAERPMPAYKRTFMDRYGADSGYIMRAVGRAFIIAIMFGGVLTSRVGLLKGILGGIAAGVVTFLIAMAFSHSAAAATKVVLAQTGASTPYQKSFSYQESLAIRGDIAGALASYEEIIAQSPGDVEVRVRAAELYAKNGGAPRAVELFREIQRMQGVSMDRDLYASHRLIDLYRGPLADEGRVLVELRRLVDRFPGSAAAEHARAALVELKRDRREEVS